MRYLARAFLSLLLAAALLRSAALSFAWADPQEVRVTDPKVLEELKVIAMHHDAARKRIKTMAVTGTVKYEEIWDSSQLPVKSPYPDGKLIHTYKGEWLRDGDNRKIHLIQKTVSEDKSFRSEDETLTTVNDEYVAELRHFGANSVIVVQPHHGVGQMLDSVAQRLKVHWVFDPMIYGFTMGNSVQGLSDKLNLPPGTLIWKLNTVPDDDGTLYVVESTFPQRKATTEARARYEIDPDKDFLITKGEYWDEYGDLAINLEVKLQKLAGGIWFPASGKIVRDGLTEEATYDKVLVNEPIDAYQFRVESIAVDPSNTTMKLYSEDGRSATTMIFYQGQWVPKHLVTSN